MGKLGPEQETVGQVQVQMGQQVDGQAVKKAVSLAGE